MRLNILTRPASSHEDPAAGFSFSKAKPVQYLDFSRKPSQGNAANANAVSTSPPTAAETLPSRNSPPRSNAVDLSQDLTKTSDSPKQVSATAIMLPVPFPNSTATGISSFDNALQEIERDDPSMSADNTLGGSDSNETNRFRQPDRYDTAHHYKLTEDHAVSVHPPDETMRSSHLVQNARPMHINKAGRAVRTPVPRTSKATKTRKKKSASGLGSSTSALDPVPFVESHNEEDLIFLLTTHTRQSRRDHEAAKAALQLNIFEVQRLKDVNVTLLARLEEIERLYNDKEAQLSKIKAAKPAWESKLKKLSDYVKGLTNDHNRLRDDARDLHDRSNSILKERNCLAEALQEVHQSATQQRDKSMRLVTEARHDLAVLGQKVEHQQSELRNNQSLLLAERERNARIEIEISKSTASHRQLTELLMGHRDTITGKIGELLRKTETLGAAGPAESQDHLTPMLEQCLTLLRNFQNANAAESENYEKLQESMRGYFEAYDLYIISQKISG